MARKVPTLVQIQLTQFRFYQTKNLLNFFFFFFLILLVFLDLPRGGTLYFAEVLAARKGH
jgi:hypothetical protein